MAVMYPKTPQFKSEGERRFFERIKELLPDEYIVYFGYRLNSYETDIILLVPNKGIVIIEIKGHLISSIYKVEDNNTIRLKDNTYITSPLKQADKYRYLLVNEIKDKFDKNVLVMPMVSYPFISKKDFKSKRLDIISDEQETLLKEDLTSSESFISKIENILNRRQNNHYHLSTDDLMCVRYLFEDNIETKIIKKNYEFNNKKPKKYYSILTYINQKTKETYIDSLIESWVSGTKIFVVSNDKQMINNVKEKLIEKTKQLYLVDKKSFKLLIDKDEKNESIKYEDSIFNFNFYEIKKYENENIEIIDGNIESNNEDFLKYLDDNTLFNLNQYKLEHAPINTDIIVKAGAGTGKTYSMISRINYLIYKHKIKADSLKNNIILITFTNEAARNMKKKLQESFENRYLLTKDIEALFMIESIEDMKISTIHSLSKKILQKFSTKLGLGQELSIVSKVHETNKEIDSSINNYLIKNKKLYSDNLISKMSSYDIRKNINLLLNKLSNKNIDIINDDLDFGQLHFDRKPPKDIIKSKQDLIEMVLSVAKQSEQNIRNCCDDENTVRLVDLITKLKFLLNNYKSDIRNETSDIKYVFVDEFQDTDDVQINLMKEFRNIFKFNFFVVGDIKQSIYRFRGAEEKSFDVLQKGEKNCMLYSLNKNYRSDKELLEKFHKIFSYWKNEYDLLEYITGNSNGQNDYLIGTKSYDNDINIMLQQIDLNYGNSKEIEENLVRLIRENKKQLQNKGTIAILVRENRQIEDIRSILNKKEYSDFYIETENGGDLYKITPTLDLYKLILALVYNKDPKYLFNLYTTSYINSPMPKVDIYKNRNDKELLLELFYKENQIENWDLYIKRLKLEPVMKVVRDIILDLKPWENYANTELHSKEKKRRKVYYKNNLEQIIEKIIKSSDTNYLTLNKLQKYLQIMIITKQNEQSRESYYYKDDEENDTKIICTTVHKSKGLEFDVVIMPYCNANISDTKKTGLVDVIVNKNKVGYKMKFKKSYEHGKFKVDVIQNNYYESQNKMEIKDRLKEETRILYVAMTRTKQKFIFFNDNNDNYEEHKKYEEEDIFTWQKLIKGE